MLFSLSSCSRGGDLTSSSHGFFSIEEQTIDEVEIEEDVLYESIIEETRVDEFITEEIYVKEIVIAETKLSELLLEDESIDEVLLCKTIYVPQKNFLDFSQNSQIAQLFGESVDLYPVIKKIAVGTGVIITLAVFRKTNLPEPVASVVVAAADKSLTFAKTGAAVGSLFGGLTGGADEIDESGRMSASIGFAFTTAGLILSAMSLLAVVPSGGSTTITAATGVHMIIAGVEVLAAAGGTAYAGYNMVKAFNATDMTNINWHSIDWETAGVSAAQKAIKNGADGYMWGSIIGTIHGGIEGYEHYQKYNAPYTTYKARIDQTPKDGNGGHWERKRGESDFILDRPIELSDGRKVYRVPYKNGIPDFSSFQKAQVDIPDLTNNRVSNFRQADEVLAEYWSTINYNGQKWTPRDVANYRTDKSLTWHEMSNMKSMQLVPKEINSQFTHSGGVAEYNAMIGQKEGVGFD